MKRRPTTPILTRCTAGTCGRCFGTAFCYDPRADTFNCARCDPQELPAAAEESATMREFLATIGIAPMG